MTNALIESALTGDADFFHYSSGEGVETGMWGIRNAELVRQSELLADRVEMATVTFLQTNPDSLYLEIEADLYDARFPGLLTPSKAMIYNVLRSYALREHGVWRSARGGCPPPSAEELKQMAGLIQNSWNTAGLCHSQG